VSQDPNKRNKDSKEVSEENIEHPTYNEDLASAVEEVGRQRDTKGGEAANPADSVII
jgi:hypothetical protein